MKKLLLALGLFLLPSLAMAQCNGVFPNNTACGNVSGTPNTPRAIPLPQTIPLPLSVANGGTGLTSFTANLPVIGSVAGGLTQGTSSGNTTTFATVNGTPTNGNCVSWNSGNVIDAGAPCGSGSGGSGTVSSGLANQLAIYPANGTTVVGTSTDPTVIAAVAHATNTANGPATYNGQTLPYVPVGGDNTSALQAAVNTAAASNLILYLPCNTTIQINSFVSLPSNTHIRGCGQTSTTLLKGAGTTGGMFLVNFVNCSTSYSNITLEQFTMDFQGSTQAANFYPVGFYMTSNVTIDHVTFEHPYSTLFIIQEPDQCGTGPGGKPAQPNGQQYMTNISVTNSTFNGTGQVVYSDLFDLLRIGNLTFSHNNISNGRGDCGAFQFDTNFEISDNLQTSCADGFYLETCYNGSIHDNSWTGYIAPLSGNNFAGIWAADANQTYTGGGYNGSHNLSIYGNHFHDFQPTSGAANVYGVWLTGPTASLPSNAVNISNNTCYNLNVAGSGTGTGVCVQWAGTLINPVAVGNVSQFTNATFVASGSYQTSGYAASNSVTGSYSAGNVP